MKKLSLALLAAALWLPSAFAQKTTVSGTIIDPKGMPYSFSSVTAQLVPQNVSPTIGTPPLQFSPFNGPISTDIEGRWNMDLFSNTSISPGGTKWRFTICIAGQAVAGVESTSVQPPIGYGNQCFTPPDITVTGSTQNLDSVINPYAPVLYRIPYTNVYVNHVFIGREVGIDFIPGTGVTITPATDDPTNYQVHLTLNATGGGTGCTLPGHDTGILTEHPVGICYNSVDATWDDTAFNLQFGPNNTISSLAVETKIIGDANIVSGTGSATLSEIQSHGFANHFTAGSAGTIDNIVFLNHNNTAQILSNTSASVTNSVVGGVNNSLSATNTSSFVSSIHSFSEDTTFSAANGSATHDVYNLGASSNYTSNGASSFLDDVIGLGFGLTAHSNNSTEITKLVMIGDVVTAQTTAAPMTDVGLFGKNLSATDCSDCYAFGENISLSGSIVSNSIHIGMAATAALQIYKNGSGDNVLRTPHAFSYYPACAAGTEGSIAAITDSASNTWGATITGGSTNHVLGYCDGTNWTVAGK